MVSLCTRATSVASLTVVIDCSVLLERSDGSTTSPVAPPLPVDVSLYGSQNAASPGELDPEEHKEGPSLLEERESPPLLEELESPPPPQPATSAVSAPMINTLLEHFMATCVLSGFIACAAVSRRSLDSYRVEPGQSGTPPT